MKPSDALISPPVFKKEAGRKMPPDVDLWGEAVFSAFSEQWPLLAEMSSGDVDWETSRLDPEEGSGIGSITVNGGGGIVRVPIVVRSFYLQPVDIFESDGKMMLLNRENIGKALGQQDNVGEPSISSRSKFPSSNFTQWLTKGATPGSWKRKLQVLEKLSNRYGGPYTERSFKKIAELAPSNENHPTSYLLKKASDDLVHVVVTGYRDGRVVSTDRIDNIDPMLDSVETLREGMKIAYCNGSAVCAGDDYLRMQKVGFAGVKPSDSNKDITGTGVYECMRVVNGGIMPVYVLAISTLQLGASKLPEELPRIYIVKSEDGLDYAVQDGVIGKPAKANSFSFEGAVTPLSEAARYQKGVLLYGESGNDPICSQPVVIDRVTTTPLGQMRVFMKSNNGNINYLINDDFKTPVKIDADNRLFVNGYLNIVGPNTMLVKLGKQVDLISSLDQYQAVYDGAISDAVEGEKEVVVKSAGVDNIVQSSLDGVIYDDTHESFIARMLSLGVAPEKSAMVVAEIKRRSNDPNAAIRIAGVRSPEKSAAPLLPDLVGLVGEIKGMRQDLIKAAAAISASGGDTESEEVGLLGLSMLDEENIRHFTEMLPDFESMSDHLAKLLFAARAGDLEVDTGAVKSALTNITKITKRLIEISSGA